MHELDINVFNPENFSKQPIMVQLEMLVKGMENVAEYSRKELEEANSKIHRLEREVQSLRDQLYGEREAEEPEQEDDEGEEGSYAPNIFDDDDVEIEEGEPDVSILAQCSSGVGLTLSHRYIGGYKLAKERNPKYKYAVVWKGGRENAYRFDSEKEAQEVLQNCKLPTGYRDPRTIADI